MIIRKITPAGGIFVRDTNHPEDYISVDYRPLLIKLGLVRPEDVYAKDRPVVT